MHNPRHLLYGRLPRFGLSPEGRRQADALGRFLAERPLAAIFSSPMLRARRTAALVAAYHPTLTVRVDRALHEIDNSWEGTPLDELDQIGWDYYSHPRHADDESLEQIRDRLCGWLARVLRRHAGAEVLGVSHGDPILVLVACLTGRTMTTHGIRPQPYIPTACVYRLDFDPGGTFLGHELFVPHQTTAAST